MFLRLIKAYEFAIQPKIMPLSASEKLCGFKSHIPSQQNINNLELGF